MTNEQVTLKMLANRLELLMGQFEELRTRYGAEMTELVHLAQGVIVETPEPSGGLQKDANGLWLVPMTRDELDWVTPAVADMSADETGSLYGRLIRIQELDGEADDDDPEDDDEEITDWEDEPEDEPLPHAGVDFAVPYQPYQMPTQEQIEAIRNELLIRPGQFENLHGGDQ